MKQSIKLLYRFIHLFGIKHGTLLFIGYKFNKLNNIVLPQIKNKLSLRSGTSDFDAFIQIFVDKHYELAYVDDPKVIIDGGANIGLFTVLMKNKFPDSRVISVEPDKENFELLKKNVSGYPDVFCENSGLWNKETTLRVYDKFQMGKWAMVVEESKEGSGINAVSVSSLMNKYAIETIDILKIDIETSEKQMFLNNYEDWLPKVKMIIIELHDEMEEGCAKPFFVAINKTFNKYTYSIKGENTIIVNNDF